MSTNAANRALDILESVAREALTVEQIGVAIGADKKTVAAWCNALERRGWLVIRRGQRKSHIGKWPMVYSLAKKWGGSA